MILQFLTRVQYCRIFGSHRELSGIIKWGPFWGDETMQIYGDSDGFSDFLIIVPCLGW